MAARIDVDRVWNAWRDRQQRPDLVKFTAERRDLISARLRLGYSAEDLIALVRYAYESQDPGPRFWRGENDRQTTYLDLENLLRKTKIGKRITLALAWASSGDDPGGGGREAAGVVVGGATAAIRARSARSSR